jgi:hypothetical protein
MDYLNNNENKLNKLKEVNKKLGLENIENNYKHSNIIFVYSVPKVGSTSLVSSLKLFVFFGFVIIHIHSEIMLECFSKVKDISVVELINYNGIFLKRNVFVIDIYRSPIEHKISTFFENISTFHFNTTDELLNNYDLTRIIKRFNLIFPYIAVGDIFIDKYNIDEKFPFDFEKKYIFFNLNGIKYIKLRLDNSHEWRKILNKLLGIDIVIIKDYSSSNKPIKNIYNQFIQNYKIPNNFLSLINSCKYLKYYYSSDEILKYLNTWRLKSLNENFNYMSENEFALYNEISLENQSNSFIDTTHYIYNGCVCKACLFKRQTIIKKLLNNKDINKEIQEKIIHENENNKLAANKNNEIKNKISLLFLKKNIKKNTKIKTLK